MHLIPWILPPLLGAVIAFCTNWIAIVMLFRPHREKRILGWRIPFTPGLVPREREKLGRKLGEAIQRHLLTPEVLAQALADPARWPGTDKIKELLTGESAHKAITAYLPRAAAFVTDLHDTHPELDEKLASLVRHIADQSIGGLTSIFVNKDKIYPSVKTWLAGYLGDKSNHAALAGKLEALNLREALAPVPTEKILAFLAEKVARQLPVADMVAQRMAVYDVAEAEAMILSVVGRELKIIVMLGGVFGFFIGLLSLIPLMLP